MSPSATSKRLQNPSRDGDDHHWPAQLVPVLDKFFPKEIFSIIQSKPPMTPFSSHPVACYLGAEQSPIPTPAREL